jgi:8-oxo-dGTP pyrophosphatase MutT (NUDIX family)
MIRRGDSLLRQLIREVLLREEECKNEGYYGRGGSGMMFVCSEDGTILLLLRANWVAQPGTWGIPGGALDEDYHETPIDPPLDDSEENEVKSLAAGKKEVVEECGSMPPDYSDGQVVGRTKYEDCGFQYVTRIVDITKEQKDGWKLRSDDGETDEFRWFPRNKLPSNLHFGVPLTLEKLDSLGVI